MSAFDDEFGLFGEASEEFERRPTLGARKIVPGEPNLDESERRELPRRTRPARIRRRSQGEERQNAASADPWAGYRRASDLLAFMARKLVQKPDRVTVELFIDEQAQPVIELIVDPEDLGKVIGRSGRVAHALRTIVRATAEGRVAVDILDSDEAAQGFEDDGHVG
jgi:uncharacterized protein